MGAEHSMDIYVSIRLKNMLHVISQVQHLEGQQMPVNKHGKYDIWEIILNK